MRISYWSSDVCSSDLVEASVSMATHYHANYVLPRWAPKLTKIEQIGAHIFYRWPGSWGKPRAFSDAYAGAEFIPVFRQLYQGGAATAAALPGEAISSDKRRVGKEGFST